MNDLAIRPENRPTILRPLVSPDELIAAQNEIAHLIVKSLKKGVDYGLVPGTQGKETLFKAGSERLQKAFGCHTAFTILEKEIDHDRLVKWTKMQWNANSRRREAATGESLGLYRYVICATVLGPNGMAVGSGLGSCSSLESKYVDRPRDLENTILKIGMKRAKVAATLDAFALSDRFTQDMEDHVETVQNDSEGFDYDNPAHKAWLVKEMAKLKIDEKHLNTLCVALQGRPSDDFDSVVAKVLGS